MPYDPAAPLPVPDGSKIRPSVAWLTTRKTDLGAPPEGSEIISVVHQGGRTFLQRVRHFMIDGKRSGDSVLLHRESLQPFATWRWSDEGTWITHYNNRVVQRRFIPRHRGSGFHTRETLEATPFSALGIELVIAALPLQPGYKVQLPVVIDTVPHGWKWMHVEVVTELTIRPRPDQPDRLTRVVDCDVGSRRIRLFITLDGHSVRRIQIINQDNVVLSQIRHMLLGGNLDIPVKPADRPRVP